jgi:membrane protease subunit (stomatin/prohibitin family)
MALKRIVKDFAGGVLADQFQSYVRSGEMGATTIMSLGEKVERNKPMTTQGTPNYLVDGSVFDVQVGQCAIVLEDGAIREVVNAATDTDPATGEKLAGQYTFETNVAPTIFGTKGFSQNFQAAFGSAVERFKTGGQVRHTHQILYFNMKNLPPLPFGAGDIKYRDAEFNISFTVGMNGKMVLKLIDPMAFYQKASINFTKEFKMDGEEGKAFFGMFKGKLSSALKVMFNRSKTTADFDELQGDAEIMCNIAKEGLGEFLSEYGMEFVDFSQYDISLSEKDAERREKLQERKLLGTDQSMMAGMMADRSMDAMNTAAGNTGGAMMGMMGMGMAQNMGGNMMGQTAQMMPQQQQPQQQYVPQQGQQQNMPQQPQQAAPAPVAQAPAGDSWTCSCGVANTNKFCGGCGGQQPEPPPPAPAGGDSWTCSCGVTNTNKFCGGCGGQQPAAAPAKVFCTGCGNEQPPDMPKFCGGCGKPF